MSACGRPHKRQSALKDVEVADDSKQSQETSGYTVERWADMETVKGRAYIVRTGNHFQYVKDGIVSDQFK